MTFEQEYDKEEEQEDAIYRLLIDEEVTFSFSNYEGLNTDMKSREYLGDYDMIQE